ncbi:head vertex assembly chaperone [Escherichia phage vB_VIPECOOM01]|uniref:Head vertex assembly chaperone n=3 Tax=Tequatrovirus vipecoom TaxID=3350239 RepID=A0AAF0JJP6_9CAUD|nr:head vertex assembly chaperone [Escherichia phage vB_VIPECOOM01]WFG77934.1 head vertex assembly chaperone [Escherichia phage vB_VIPECOOM02]WFG78203.1 head vertex assembly chaperone [Escherichia phage vB_VIPECOOM03]
MNKDDLDLNLEIIDESPSSEGEEERKERLFNESLKIIKSAMENVIQEIVIKLEDGSTHIVYVTKLDWVDGKVIMDFAVLDQERKAELAPHVEKCITMQLQDAFNKRSKKKFKFF